MHGQPPFSEATVLQHTTAESFSRGREYVERGAVTGLVVRGSTLQAEVEGSEYAPYRVRVTFDAGGITGATCSCPYEWGGWCKHIVAALLAYLEHPDRVETHPPLEAVLADLDREQLQELLLHLVARTPDLAEAIDAHLAVTGAPGAEAETAAPGAPRLRHAPVDPRPVQRQVRAILRPTGYGGYGDYGYARSAVGEMGAVLRQALRFAEGGDGRNALLLLEAITDEYVENWYEIDDSDGYLGGFFAELAESWAEALLSEELPASERHEWARKLAHWQHEAEDYGVGDEFAIARLAAEQGWDDPAVRRALRGEAAPRDVWDDDAPPYADELAAIRLRILERQGRADEYLALARAEGQFASYVMMLAKRGRFQEAVDAGLSSLATASEALALAALLRERGELDGAVRIAEHGLTLAEPRGPLAEWLADVATGLGRHALALRSAELAFRSAPSLAAYLKVRELAGEAWPALRTALLDHLRANAAHWAYHTAAVDVFLHEELIDDAIASVKDSYSYDLLERVMDAAIASRPEWVIRAATAQARRIIDAGKAQRYDHAVEWLRRARDAYRVAGREADWQAYLAEVREQHGRKHKLMGLLAKL